MYLTEANRQNLTFFILIILTALLVIFLYRTTHHSWILFREAEGKFHQKKYAEAIPLYMESLKGGKTTEDIYLKLATAYISVGNFKDSIPLLKTYLSAHPKDKNTRRLLAGALEWSGDFEGAEIEYKKILENNP